MKTIDELIAYLHSQDIKLWAEGDRLRYSVPKNKESMLSAIHTELAERKTEILAFLNKAKQVTQINRSPIVFENNPTHRELFQSSPYFQLERRSLLSLLATKKIPPVDAAALSYLPNYMLEQTDLNREEMIEQWFENLPVLSRIIETAWGRIAMLLLPRFDFELYADIEDIVGMSLDALEMTGFIGARTVSLTGLLSSATDYGRAIVKAMADRQLPQLSSGHATTSATVVLAIKRILQESEREIAKERVGFLGLGSIGLSSLRLMLKCLPHPVEIMLCDVYNKKTFLEGIEKEIVNELGFCGTVRLLLANTEPPPDLYSATLMVGATNVPDILDITQLNPGTLVVDDSAPHCFKSEWAIKRVEKHQDILFTEGGVLKSPQPLQTVMYLPHHVEKGLKSKQNEDLLAGDPYEIAGCIFSSLLSSSYENLKPTVGFVQLNESIEHYEMLVSLGFQAADLHCEDYVLSEDVIGHFQKRFGH
jgi:hypothetical protein